MNLDSPTTLIFLVPGFVTVWSYRYFTKSKKTGEFEYAGLSAFWGLANLFLYELLLWNNQEKIRSLLSNVYGAATILSFLGFCLAFAAAKMKWSDQAKNIWSLASKALMRLNNK